MDSPRTGDYFLFITKYRGNAGLGPGEGLYPLGAGLGPAPYRTARIAGSAVCCAVAPQQTSRGPVKAPGQGAGKAAGYIPVSVRGE